METLSTLLISSEAKSTIVNMFVKWLMGLLVTRASFFAVGPVYWVIGKVLYHVISWSLDKGIKEAEATWSEHEKLELADNISKLISSYDTASVEDKEKIEDEIIINAKSLIKLVKSA